MRKTFIALLALTVLATAGEENMLDESDFAGGAWGAWRPIGDHVRVVEFEDGRGVRLGSDPETYQRLLYREDIMVQPEMLYEISFRYRCPHSRSSHVRFRVAGATFQREFPEAAEWTPASLDIAVPPDGQAGILDFFTRPGSGTECELRDITMELTGKGDFRSCETWSRLAADALQHSGWRLTETPDYLALSRGLQTEYFARGEQRLLREQWQRSGRLGLEQQRLDYHFERVPVGVYFYVGRNLGIAAARGQDWRAVFDRVFRRLAENHFTTVFVGNTHWDQERDGVGQLEGLRQTFDLAADHELALIVQPSSLYFRPRETLAATRAAWPAALDSARELFAELDGHPALLAWCFKEEIKPDHAPWLEEYYRELRCLPFSKPVYLLNNNIASARRSWDPAPDIFAFDRYYFKYVTYLGYLRPPRSALTAVAHDSAEFFRASQYHAAPFLYVGAGCATLSVQADAGEAVLETDRGWTQDPETGNWTGYMRYYPPPGGMRAQGWISVAIGGKGILFWLYGIPPGPVPETGGKGFEGAGFGLGSDAAGKEPPQLAEAGRLAAELRALEPFILNRIRRPLDAATCGESETLVTTHRMEATGETVIAVVNLHLGTVGGKSPKQLAPEDVLSVDPRTGQLVGFAAAMPRDLRIAVPGLTDVCDLKTGESLAVEDGSCTVRLGPGEGTLLLLGTPADAARIRASLTR